MVDLASNMLLEGPLQWAIGRHMPFDRLQKLFVTIEEGKAFSAEESKASSVIREQSLSATCTPLRWVPSASIIWRRYTVAP